MQDDVSSSFEREELENPDYLISVLEIFKS